MWVWYITMLNSLFGIACFIYCHIVYASVAGKSCFANQPTRYYWLMAEIIIFWTTFWIYLFPFFYMRCFKKETVHELLYAEPEESEEEEE